MKNTFNKPEKLERQEELRRLAKKALEQAGWRVEKTPGSGKSSLLRITKGDKQYTASVRTTQDQRITFPRKKDDSDWLTLDEADYVVAATVDDKNNPQKSLVSGQTILSLIWRFGKIFYFLIDKMSSCLLL